MDNQLFAEEFRLKTYSDKNWPLAFLKAEVLAKSGFFYLGVDDQVKCPFCRVVVFNWQNGDIPIFEHRIHSPKCTFINGQPCGNIFIGEDPVVVFGLVGEDTCGGPKNVKKEEVSLESQGPGIPFQFPKNVEYITYDSRLATFSDWPRPDVKPARLAECGFYYKGPVCDRFGQRYIDFVICFHCGIALSRWEATDDPWVEHKKWSSECPFLTLADPTKYPLSLSTSQDVSSTPVESSVSLESPPTSKVTSSTSQEPPIERIAALAITSLQSLNISETITSESSTTSPINPPQEPTPKSSELSLVPYTPFKWLPKPKIDILSCKVCLDFQVSVVFSPCKHTACVLCSCSLSKRSCPICRTKIERLIRLDHELTGEEMYIFL